MSEVDRFHLGLVERVSRWSALVLVVACATALALDARAAAGIGFGGGLSLGMLTFYRGLANRWTRSRRRRAAGAFFWVLWFLKWPALGALLYIVLSRGWVTPGWLCMGAGLVPAVTTGLALKALAADGWRRTDAVGAKP
jgi:hypothetical protein